jgi:hypothetical protein
MRQITARGWFSRRASSTAVVIAFLFALDHPLHAQATLIVSDFNQGGGGSYVSFFQYNIKRIGATSPGSGGGEGVACIAGATTEIIAANNGPTIDTYSANLTDGTLTFLSAYPSQAAGVAGLSLNGSTLYAAVGAGSIVAFDVASETVIHTSIPPLSGFHDVLYDPSNQIVYGTTNGATSVSGTLYAFDAATLNRAALYDILLPTGVTTGYKGLAVDKTGNIFVSDSGTFVGGPSTPGGVYEFSPIPTTPSVPDTSVRFRHNILRLRSSALFHEPAIRRALRDGRWS